MRITDAIAPLARRGTGSAPSPYLFDWDARDLTVSPRTGQVPTYTRPGAGSYVDSRGYVRQAPYGMPRFSRSPSSGIIGLLMERAGTNAVASNGLAAANWVLTAATVAPEVWAGVPMGRLAASGTGLGSAARVIGTVNTAQRKVAVSFCVKRGRHATNATGLVDLWDSVNSVSRFTARVTGWDPSTGAPIVTVNASNVLLGVERLADGVWRVLGRSEDCAVVTHSLAVYANLADGAAGEIVVGGLQVEDQPAPTSIMFSANATKATRAADKLTYPVGWLPRDLTIYAEWARPAWVGLSPLTGYRTLVNLGNERALLYDGTAGVLQAYAYGTSTSSTSVSYPAGEWGTVVRAAARIANVATGVTPTIESESASASGISGGVQSAYGSALLGIGCNPTGVGYELNGLIHRVRIRAGAHSLAAMREGY